MHDSPVFGLRKVMFALIGLLFFLGEPFNGVAHLIYFLLFPLKILLPSPGNSPIAPAGV